MLYGQSNNRAKDSKRQSLSVADIEQIGSKDLLYLL